MMEGWGRGDGRGDEPGEEARGRENIDEDGKVQCSDHTLIDFIWHFDSLAGGTARQEVCIAGTKSSTGTKD